MKRLISCVLSACLWFSAMNVIACEKDELAGKVLTFSGYSTKIEKIIKMFLEMMNSELFVNFSDQEKLDASQIIFSYVSKGTLMSNVIKKISQGLTLEEMRTLLAWYESEISERLKEMEKTSMNEEALMMAYQNTENLIKEHADRLPLVQVIAQSSRSEELMQKVKQFYMDIFFIMNGTPVSKIESGAICEVSDGNAWEVLVMACLLHVYANASNDDLEKLKTHVLSDVFVNLTELVLKAIDQTFAELRQQLTDQFAYKVQ
ncbi:MAG: hypothetical protein OXE99_03900 [Cellvibrionales bacterium]|nr:hypothetical protein [Cellvibrionales bacterium]